MKEIKGNWLAGFRVCIVHDNIMEQASLDEKDTLIQVEAIQHSLLDLGVEVVLQPFVPDFDLLCARLQVFSPDIIVNLVETLKGAQWVYLAPEWFQKSGYPYTGCSSKALLETSVKTRAKERMYKQGIPTPCWAVLSPDHESVLIYGDEQNKQNLFTHPVIVKPIEEDASIGISDASIVSAGSREALRNILLGSSENPSELFVESFINGREYNISLLEVSDGTVLVLPPAEIVFQDYPEGKPKIVGYDAKWLEQSFENLHTVRIFPDRDKEGKLFSKLEQVALECWRVFGLSGYARVDVRVDDLGNIWVLEINANPCISPDSGFVAAAASYGFTFTQVVENLIAAAQRRGVF